MYGYSGYGTNTYAGRRFSGPAIFAPVVKLAMTVIRNTYGVVSNFRSAYGVSVAVRSTYNVARAFKNTYGIGTVVRLLFKNSTLEL
jgi:hypothetical protein